MEKISFEDQRELSLFFRGILRDGSFATTLFGYKPAATFDYPLYYTFKFAEKFTRERLLIERKGWNLWRKYQSLFPIRGYQFAYDTCDGERESLSVNFVHIKKMSEIFDRYPVITTRFLPEKNPLEEAHNILFYPKFKFAHHFIQGLLLGYPEQECRDFSFSMILKTTLGYFPYESDAYDDHSLTDDVVAQLCDATTCDLLKQEQQFNETFSCKPVWLRTNPFFCSVPYEIAAFQMRIDPNLEEIKRKVIDLFNSDHFLEEFLTILCEEA